MQCRANLVVEGGKGGGSGGNVRIEVCCCNFIGASKLTCLLLVRRGREGGGIVELPSFAEKIAARRDCASVNVKAPRAMKAWRNARLVSSY